MFVRVFVQEREKFADSLEEPHIEGMRVLPDFILLKRASLSLAAH